MINVNNANNNNYSVLLGERFDFNCVDEFRKSYESIDLNSEMTVIFDFTHTKYMDSSALGMLINARAHISSSDAKAVIANCNDQIAKIFSISRFDKKFDII